MAATSKTEFLEARKSARTSLDGEYSNGLYGPATNICTFVLLNDLDPIQIKNSFAEAIIAAGPWTTSNDKAVHFLFSSAIVFELNADGSRRKYMGFSAQVKYTRGYYDIYHVNGGIEPV